MDEFEFFIVNTGKVALLNYSVSQHLVSCKNTIFEISANLPVRSSPHEKQKIVVKFKPGLPEKIFEKLVLEIAHFMTLSIFLFTGKVSTVSLLSQLPLASSR